MGSYLEMYEEKGIDQDINTILSSTGSISNSSRYNLVFVTFEKYQIGVVVDSNGKFVGISEVREKRDFLSEKQRISVTESINVDDYYKE
jgi:hypothetical protein